jgi:hypothetical protein
VLHRVDVRSGIGCHTAPFSCIDFQAVDQIGFLCNVSIHQPFEAENGFTKLKVARQGIVTKRDKRYNLMFRSQSHISSSKNSNGKLCVKANEEETKDDESCGQTQANNNTRANHP